MRFSLMEQIGGALLICAWLIYGSIFVGNLLVRVEAHTPIAADHAAAGESEGEKEQAAGEEPAEEVDFAALLASADEAAGEKVFGKCKACHSIEQGGPNKVGPNLWGVVGRPKASAAGFSYSEALSGLGGEWGYEDLNAFLASPKEYAPGNKMTFAGLKKPEDRAEVVLYLRSHSDSPKPLP